MTDFNEEFKGKKLKNNIKFQIPLTEEQKLAKAIVLNSTITVLTGEAGTGKTMLASQIALDLLFTKTVSKIILTRPAVNAGEELGFLPGDKDAKLSQYVAPIVENMFDIYDKSKLEKEMQEGRIEIIPVAFMRGRNLKGACVVVDEAQNLTDIQTKLLLTRVCVGTKVIFCGDVDQTDLPSSKQSGFPFLLNNVAGNIRGFGKVHLIENHRDPIVEEILRVYSENKK
jgi:phosphate starvation-inducible PhoH-like protein